MRRKDWASSLKGPWMALVKPTPGAAMERTNHARSAGPDGRGIDLLVSFGGAGHPGDCQKKLAQQGETRLSGTSPSAMKQNVHPTHPALPGRKRTKEKGVPPARTPLFDDHRRAGQSSPTLAVCTVQPQTSSAGWSACGGPSHSLIAWQRWSKHSW